VRLTPKLLADLGLGEAVAGHGAEVVQLRLELAVDELREVGAGVQHRA
jgi:hypothetical protein